MSSVLSFRGEGRPRPACNNPRIPFCRTRFTSRRICFFKYNRRLLGHLCRCALRSLTRYFEMATGSALTPGVIAAIQTFGDRINLHVHLHFLVTQRGTDEAGVFHKIPRIDDSRLEAESSATSSSPMLRRSPRRLRSPRRSSWWPRIPRPNISH